MTFTSTRTFSFLLVAALSLGVANAQPGSLDPTLNLGTSIDQHTSCVAVQPDGKLVVAGYFTTLAGGTRWGLARLLPNGTLDPAFNSGTSIQPTIQSQAVRVMALQPDGKVLLGGSVVWDNGGVLRRCLLRFNADGTPDPGFGLGTAITGGVGAVLVQPDGKILVGGHFTSNTQGLRRSNFTRLLPDGTHDPSFQTMSMGIPGSIESIVYQPDGKYLIGGSFILNGGTSWAKNLGRLNADGTVDASFAPAGTSFDGPVDEIVRQPDGKIVALGNFTSFNGTPAPGIARILPDGTLDPSFAVGTGFSGAPSRVRLLRNGQLLVAGDFSSYQGTNSRNLVLINPDGSPDATFAAATASGAFNSAVLDLDLQRDGKIVCAGSFTTYGPDAVPYLARLQGNLATTTRAAAPPVAWQVYQGAEPGLFRLQSEKPLTALRVTDALGRLVASPAPTATLDLRPLPAGVYFVQARWGEVRHTRRVVKE